MRAIKVLVAGGIMLGCVATTAAAQAPGPTCAADAVTARGEPARLQWLALIKARGNWRARVRAIPNLGPDYANYGRAINAQERCITSPVSVWCEVSAMPCAAR